MPSNFDPEIHHRRSIRLRGYDYSQPGSYFITLCTSGKKCLFGNVLEDKMVQNETGKMVEEVWRAMPGRFAGIEVDEFVVMPNHLHAILRIVGAPLAGAHVARAGTSPAPTVGDIVGAFKSISTIAISRMARFAGTKSHTKLWQRNYFEHIIRDETELGKIREYIQTNPLRWAFDRENPNP